MNNNQTQIDDIHPERTYEDVDIGKVASSLRSQFDEEIMKISQDKV